MASGTNEGERLSFSLSHIISQSFIPSEWVIVYLLKENEPVEHQAKEKIFLAVLSAHDLDEIDKASGDGGAWGWGASE